MAGVEVAKKLVDEDSREGRNQRDEHREVTGDPGRPRGDECEDNRRGHASRRVGEPQRFERTRHTCGKLDGRQSGQGVSEGQRVSDGTGGQDQCR